MIKVLKIRLNEGSKEKLTAVLFLSTMIFIYFIRTTFTSLENWYQMVLVNILFESPGK